MGQIINYEVFQSHQSRRNEIFRRLDQAKEWYDVIFRDARPSLVAKIRLRFVRPKEIVRPFDQKVFHYKEIGKKTYGLIDQLEAEKRQAPSTHSGRSRHG